MAVLDKEIRVIALKGERGTNGQDGQDGQDGKSSYELAVEEELFSGTLQEWIETFATPENYITRTEFQKVTQAQYDAMEQAGTLVPNCYYLIIDDTTAQDFEDLKNDTIINNAKHLYMHNLRIQGTITGYSYDVFATLYTKNNTPITVSNIFNCFAEQTVNFIKLECNGLVGTYEFHSIVYDIMIDKRTNELKIEYWYNDDYQSLDITSSATINDKITQIF